MVPPRSGGSPQVKCCMRRRGVPTQHKVVYGYRGVGIKLSAHILDLRRASARRGQRFPGNVFRRRAQGKRLGAGGAMIAGRRPA
jgi:hypothetical protein